MRFLTLILPFSLALWACDSDDNSADPTPDMGGQAGQGGGQGEAGQGEAGQGEAGQGDFEEARSAKSRVINPDVPEGDLATLIEGQAAFSFDLYRALAAQEGNLFFSPFSVSQALAMTWAGARGVTEAEMAQVLHFDLPQAQLHPAYNAFDQLLHSRSQLEAYEEGDGFELSVANAVWGRLGWHFLEGFLDILAESYGAGLRLIDFAADPEAARRTINAWVEAVTRERIKDLIPEGTISDLTVMVLVNAIYFKASWRYPFDEDGTTEGDFHAASGDTVRAEMMQVTEYLGYAQGDGFEAIKLPYIGDDLSMLVIAPDLGQLSAFEATLSAARLAEVQAQIGHSDSIHLRLPKFSFTYSALLKQILSEMGMPSAFNGDSDFSGIDGSRDLYIGQVIHKAFVAVDEEGTEAAAATAVVLDGRGMPEEPIEVSVDRPFIFFILDRSGAILFAGRVLDPTL
ncbi:serpin family protein [Myxococcota bacterium]|nr:serpin family protein [Myxococcota bacterium]